MFKRQFTYNYVNGDLATMLNRIYTDGNLLPTDFIINNLPQGTDYNAACAAFPADQGTFTYANGIFTYTPLQ